MSDEGRALVKAPDLERGERERSFRDHPELPARGDTIEMGPIRLRVGHHNGDFRSVRVCAYFPSEGQEVCFAHGNLPARALAEIVEADAVGEL